MNEGFNQGYIFRTDNELQLILKAKTHGGTHLYGSMSFFSRT